MKPMPHEAEQLVVRKASLLPGVDEEQRSVPITLATESAIETLDLERMEIVREVLVLDGMDVPKQVPLIDSHNRETTRNVFGSIRDLRVAGEGASLRNLDGRAFFSRKQAAVDAFRDVADGHIEDFSVSARRLEVAYVGRGDTATFRGQTLRGPARLVTRSRLLDGSIVAIGADPSAKAKLHPVYRAYRDPHSFKDELMFEKLKAFCIARGMAPETADADVLGWLERHVADPKAPKDGVAELSEILRELKALPPGGSGKQSDDETQRKAAVEAERTRTHDILRLCQRHAIDDKSADAWIKEGLTVDQVSRKILDAKGAQQNGKPLGAGIEHVESEYEKFFAAAGAALTLRAVQAARVNPEAALERARGVYTYQDTHGGEVKVSTGAVDVDAVQRCEALVETVRKPPQGYSDFRHAGILEIARAYCEMHGQRTAFWPKQKIAREAIRLSNAEAMRSEGAYNTTGSFSNLLLDAANKTLLAAYDEAAVTYPAWVRTAPSAPDFKTLNRIRFGELPDPEIVPENHPYPEKQTSDAKESYAVEKVGALFSVSLEAVVNDDLNAISRIPAMQGNSMRRKINKVVYAILTSNPALSDGIAIFHASSHGANLGAAVPSVTSFNAGWKAMMLQTGLSGTGTILNIQPKYVISGATLSASILQILNSIADPAAGGTAAGNANTANIYGPNGPRRVMPVFDGQLDAAAASTPTGWWFVADSSQVDTVELCFLAGEESPVLDREDGFNVDCIKYKIRQTFAAKAIDYRGMYQGNAVG